jgi:hypothetical protein
MTAGSVSDRTDHELEPLGGDLPVAVFRDGDLAAPARLFWRAVITADLTHFSLYHVIVPV